jgi:hypothetical protein
MSSALANRFSFLSGFLFFERLIVQQFGMCIVFYGSSSAHELLSNNSTL